MLAQLKRELANSPVKDLYYQYLLGQDIWYFRDYLRLKDPAGEYDKFKRFISQNLDVHFNNIAIVGSAKTGYSFNPKNKLRRFSDQSDIDIILVSDKLFKQISSAYLQMYYNQEVIPEYEAVAKSVFKNFISLKDPTLKHKVIIDWQKKVSPFLKDLQLIFSIKNPINYRIYESWESVESYHYYGLKQLKAQINNNLKREMEIYNIVKNIRTFQEMQLIQLISTLKR